MEVRKERRGVSSRKPGSPALRGESLAFRSSSALVGQQRIHTGEECLNVMDISKNSLLVSAELNIREST